MPASSTQSHATLTPGTISISGELTISGVAEFRAQATSTLQACRDAVTIDCTEVDYIDVAGLQALAALRVEAKMRRLSVAIRGVQSSVLADARLLGMAEVLTSHPQPTEDS